MNPLSPASPTNREFVLKTPDSELPHTESSLGALHLPSPVLTSPVSSGLSEHTAFGHGAYGTRNFPIQGTNQMNVELRGGRYAEYDPRAPGPVFSSPAFLDPVQMLAPRIAEESFSSSSTAAIPRSQFDRLHPPTMHSPTTQTNRSPFYSPPTNFLPQTVFSPPVVMLNGIPTANDGSWQTQHFGAAQQSSPYFDPAIYGGDPHEFEDDYYVEPAPSIVPTRVFGGGGRWIRGLAVDTPTNSLLVSGDDARIRIWDLVTGQLRRTLRGHKAPVYSLAVDGTNGLVYSGGMDGMLLAHDPRTKQPVAKFELHDDSVRSLVLRRDGAKFYSAGYDGRLAEWDPRKGTPRVLVKPGHAKAGWLRSLALDPSQQHLYYISDTALACIHILSASTLWTQRTETPLRTLHLDYAGRFLYTGGQDSAIIQWDALNGAPQGSLNSHRGWVTSLATHPAEPRRLFSVSLDTTIKEWDLARGTLTTTWEPKAGPVENLVLDPEGRPRMWTTGWGAGVGEWRVPDGWWLEDGDGV